MRDASATERDHTQVGNIEVAFSYGVAKGTGSIEKPILNSTDVRSLICDGPTNEKRCLHWCRRNVEIRKPKRTTAANMLKRAKLTATIPDAGNMGPQARTKSALRLWAAAFYL